MRAGERLVATDGKEVCLFPCEAMYITDGSGEHGVLALDFLPRTTTGMVITHMACYAPFSGKIVYTGNDNNCILESNDKVHMPDGSLAYARVLVAHNDLPSILGTTYVQGQQFYTTGNYGLSTGEHLHMEIASVDDKSLQYWNTGGIGLYNAIHMWNGMYVNDTVLLQDNDYNWQIYEQGREIDKKSHFKWVLYGRKFRERRRKNGLI